MSTDIKSSELSKLELFEDLNKNEIESIEPYFHKRTYQRNDIVYINESEAHQFLFLVEGKMKIFRLSELGKEQVIRLIEPTEFTGELALFEGVRKAYASVLEPSIVYTIDHDDFKKILADFPLISLKMIKILATRLHLSEQQTSYLSGVSAKERLWIYLDKEAQKIDGKLMVHHTETKRFVAAYLGMSSETLSRALSQLEIEGRIKRVSHHYLEILPDV